MTIYEKLESYERAITVTELAAILEFGKTTLYDMAHRGSIPHFRFGYTIRFDPHQIAAWLAEHTLREISGAGKYIGRK